MARFFFEPACSANKKMLPPLTFSPSLDREDVNMINIESTPRAAKKQTKTRAGAPRKTRTPKAGVSQTTGGAKSAPQTIDDPKRILELLQAVGESAGGKLQVPPPSFLTMDAAVQSYTPGSSLTVSFPVKEQYLNPLGRMQGGFICAAMDNTLGPLSFLVSGGAAVTLSMNLDFVRGIKAGDTLRVTATVLSRSRTNLIMDALAHDGRGKLVARASTQFQVFAVRAKDRVEKN